MVFTLIVVSIFSVSSVTFASFNKNDSLGYLLEQHQTILEHDYNECSYSSVADDEGKSWFVLESNSVSRHFPHSSGTSEIKYYVSDTNPNDSTIDWNHAMPNDWQGNIVKQNFVNSVLKWNNVFFYKYNSSGLITKNKLVNVTEGDSSNYNVIIYPEIESNMLNPTTTAQTGPDGSAVYNVIQNGVTHKHFTSWHIAVNLDHSNINGNNANTLDKVGAHELGHVLGLRDIDKEEACGNHHSELLMGYASPIQTNITYKDLVGVAITRGYHNDDDHKWIYISSGHDHYKLVCSICNGINYVESLSGINYVDYKYCNDNHSLSSGNMFAVASYENKDYYKCKYCQYVAPFDDRVQQQYDSDLDLNNQTRHITTNYAAGLSYSFYENHSFDSNYYCSACDYQHSHSYTDHHVYYSQFFHTSYCWCGVSQLNAHAIDFTTLHNGPGHTMYGDCIDCGATVVIGDIPFDPPFANNTFVTDNGSYILPNGIKIIVEEDLESYLNHTLMFHPYGEITE